MAKIKPQALLQQSKKKKGPNRISAVTIVINGFIVVVMAFFLFTSYRYWNRRVKISNGGYVIRRRALHRFGPIAFVAQLAEEEYVIVGGAELGLEMHFGDESGGAAAGEILGGEAGEVGAASCSGGGGSGGKWRPGGGGGIGGVVIYVDLARVDGKVDDWNDAVRDGKDAYFVLQVNGNYAYTQRDGNKCASVALMFQIGENATYHSMGRCEDGPDACTNKTCSRHEVDIMHFSIGDTIPGRLYSGNPIDNREGYGGLVI
ncbi:hypothetical protein CASFOL_002614 [Castilleja foliolosa]|uniref:Uncharacterized protein n=1 Tax=Castilleja foliolosa TaxID=1961234 RepID=A0ABD3EET2_9LAMI